MVKTITYSVRGYKNKNVNDSDWGVKAYIQLDFENSEQSPIDYPFTEAEQELFKEAIELAVDKFFGSETFELDNI